MHRVAVPSRLARALAVAGLAGAVAWEPGPALTDQSRPESLGPVARCTSSTRILVYQIKSDSMAVVETRLDGTPVRTLVQQASLRYIPVDPTRTHAVTTSGLVDLASGAIRPLIGAKTLQSPAFVNERTIVGSIQHSARGFPWTSTIEVRDLLTDSLVASVAGFEPAVARDGSVLFLRIQTPPATVDTTAPWMPGYIDIMRWRPGRVDSLKRVEMSEEGGPYAVTEVVPLPGDGYTYRVYDEHEYRYYQANDSAFFPGASHGSPEHTAKEQYSLTISDDGRIAAYTERNWNELTYLVVVDLTTGTRTQTSYYGSFPHVYGEYVVFVSDPSFVTGGDHHFRQIEHDALYAYHLPSGALCQVAAYPFPARVE